MLDDKVMKKDNQELLELHKRCLVYYFSLNDVKLKTRKKFFRLYDKYISHKNIRQYFFRNMRLFIVALVTDRLSEISDYEVKKSKKKK